MKVFSRNIAVDFEECADDSMLVTSHLEDMVHDITVKMVISRPDLVIQQAEARMERVPGDHCHEICPVVKQLEGLSIKSGFTKKVTTLLRDEGGCPNILNLIMVAAPLVINAFWVADHNKGIRTLTDTQKSMAKSLEGVCIGYGKKQKTN